MDRFLYAKKLLTTFYSLRRTFSTIGSAAGDKIAVDFVMGHIAASDDMSAVYRQKTYDGPLKKVTDHVRDWLSREEYRVNGKSTLRRRRRWGGAFGANLPGRLASKSFSASRGTRYRGRLPLPTLMACNAPAAIQLRTVSGETL